MNGERTGWLRRVAPWVMISPFLLLSLIAPDVMPARIGNTITMVLCTGHGVSEIVVDAETLDPVKQAPRDNLDRCAWAAVQIAVDLTQPVTLPRLATGVWLLNPPAVPTILARATATGLPPATGPPVRV